MLTTNVPDEDLEAGDVGTVVHVHKGDEGFEVEFMTLTGETVVVRRHGKPIVRLVPDSTFMNGRKAADLFRCHKAGTLDRQAADAIEGQIRKLERTPVP